MTANRVQPYLDDGDITLYHGDALTVLQGLPAGLAQTCVTSPPYWGLRDYGATGQLGLEASPDLYVERLASVFREVRRVLRDDGTLWLNLGDSYAGSTMGGGPAASSTLVGTHHTEREGARFASPPRLMDGLKPKDLVGIPWRVAFALQADGWYLRSDIIWSKPNPMPESVTDRPTKSHEYVFLFSKQPRYFYDADSIREPADEGSIARESRARLSAYEAPGQVANRRPPNQDGHGRRHAGFNGRWDDAEANGWVQSGRNRRSVWTIPTEPFPEAHFATYPQELVRPCILAGTSERGECVECGAPWMREVERDLVLHQRTLNVNGQAPRGALGNQGDNRAADGHVPGHHETRTVGWAPSCYCGVGPVDVTRGTMPPVHVAAAIRPQLVLDPFLGSGTTALVARKHGRRCIGIDLSAEYLAIAAKRTQQLSLLGGVA